MRAQGCPGAFKEAVPRISAWVIQKVISEITAAHGADLVWGKRIPPTTRRDPGLGVEILEGGRAWCGWPVGFMGLVVHGAVRVAERSRGRSRLEDEERKVGGDAAMVGPNGQRLKVQERHE